MRNSSKFNYDYFAKYFKKGLNIFIFITFIILLVVSLSGFKKKGYNLFVEFNNAHRIKKGTNVTLQGVLVGYVNSISICLLYTSPSPRDLSTSRMPSSA